VGNGFIWYGTPQWQIEASVARDSEALVAKHGYAPLTRPVKEQIFGLTRLAFSIGRERKRQGDPKDYLSRMKMIYLEEARAQSPLVRGGPRDSRAPPTSANQGWAVRLALASRV